ncbi:hypothetical protein BC829DRAFT_485846 [Chytridium lagenaria]|nr:hypothetical protein BC829DRAFT_485846 [Chytridium lagenaria]
MAHFPPSPQKSTTTTMVTASTEGRTVGVACIMAWKYGSVSRRTPSPHTPRPPQTPINRQPPSPSSPTPSNSNTQSPSSSNQRPIVLRESVASRCKLLCKPSSMFLSNVWDEMVPEVEHCQNKPSLMLERYEMSIPRRNAFPGDEIALTLAVRPETQRGREESQEKDYIVSPPLMMERLKPKVVDGLQAIKYLNTVTFDDPSLWATQLSSDESTTLPKVATHTISIRIPPETHPTHLWTGNAAHRHIISVAIFTDEKSAPPTDPETSRASVIVEFPIFVLSLSMPNRKLAVPVIPRIPRAEMVVIAIVLEGLKPASVNAEKTASSTVLTPTASTAMALTSGVNARALCTSTTTQDAVGRSTWFPIANRVVKGD